MKGKVSHQKAFSRRDIFLYCITAVLILDTLAVGAVMGPTIVFWWVILTILFFLPFGAISIELGVHYPEKGGIYAWVKRVYGRRMASRISWYYWANVAVWLPSVFILFTGISSQLFFPNLSLSNQIVLGTFLIWIVALTNVLKLTIGKWLFNVGAVIKLIIFGVLIIGGVNYAMQNGIANEFNFRTIIPNLEDEGSRLQYLPAVIYGMLGFELVSASSEEMKCPKRDLPIAVFSSILIIVLVYVSSTFAILIALPAEKVDVVDGLIDTLTLFFGETESGRWFITLIGVGALYSFFSSASAWALGANKAAVRASIDKEFPKLFGKETKQGMPLGAGIMMGITSTTILILYGLVANTNASLFWTLFAFSGVIFMLPYVVMSLAFVQIREQENHLSENKEGFRFPGPKLFVKFMSYHCSAILMLSILLFLWTPGEAIHWEVIAGALAVITIGEGIIRLKEL